MLALAQARHYLEQLQLPHAAAVLERGLYDPPGERVLRVDVSVEERARRAPAKPPGHQEDGHHQARQGQRRPAHEREPHQAAFESNLPARAPVWAPSRTVH